MDNKDWTLQQGSNSAHCCFEQTILDEYGNHVCELWSEHGSLLAAAPNLYAALDDLCISIKDIVAQHGIDLEPALNAMFKADGEQQK